MFFFPQRHARAASGRTAWLSLSATCPSCAEVARGASPGGSSCKDQRRAGRVYEVASSRSAPSAWQRVPGVVLRRVHCPCEGVPLGSRHIAVRCAEKKKSERLSAYQVSMHTVQPCSFTDSHTHTDIQGDENASHAAGIV